MTPASQRSRRSQTKGSWEYGVKRTLEDEFKEIAASNVGLSRRKNKQSQDSHADVTMDEPKEKETEDSGAVIETSTAPETASCPDHSSAYEMTAELNGRQPKVEDTDSETYETQTHPGPEESEHPWPGRTHIVFDEAGHTTTSKPHDVDTSANQASRTRRDTAHDEDDSDDDAPETITNASAIAKAKQVVAHAAKAAEREKADKKLKRRQLDVRLKEQARQSQQKKRRSDAAGAVPPTELAGYSATSTATHSTARTPQRSAAADADDASSVPALLPASLLARAGDVRPPTPERNPALNILDPKLQRRNQHIKFIEQGERPAKDVQKGPVMVRVLETQNKLMAPKQSRDSKLLREYLLQGRNGDGSYRKYARGERQKASSGFLKKR